MGHFYGNVFFSLDLVKLFSSVVMICWNGNKFEGVDGVVGEFQGLDGTCAIPLPGVQTHHHEIRAGTPGRCLTTGCGPTQGGFRVGYWASLTEAQPVLVPMVLGSCGNPVSWLARTGLHCTGKRGERRWKWEGRSRRASWENKRRTLHIAPSDQWGRGLRSRWWQITGWSLTQQWQWPHSQALLHRCVSPPSILIRWCYHCHCQFQWLSFKISSCINAIY